MPYTLVVRVNYKLSVGVLHLAYVDGAITTRENKINLGAPAAFRRCAPPIYLIFVFISTSRIDKDRNKTPEIRAAFRFVGLWSRMV